MSGVKRKPNKDANIAAQIKELTNVADGVSWTSGELIAACIRDQQEKITALESRCEKYRAALERVAEEGLGATYVIAREALKEEK